MDVWIWCILVSYALAGGAAYWYLHKSRKLVGYHMGMNIAMTSAGVTGLATGAVLGTRMHHHNAVAVIAATLIAVLIGVLFGALVDYQTVLTGVTSGAMSGMMGPMIGLHSSQPALIIAFSSLLVYLSFFLLCTSRRFFY